MLNWDAHHMTGTRYLSTLGLSLVCYLASFPHLLLQLFRAAKVKWCTDRTSLSLSAAETHEAFAPLLRCSTKAFHKLSKHISFPRPLPMSVQINRYMDVAHTHQEEGKKIWAEEDRAEVPDCLSFTHTTAERGQWTSNECRFYWKGVIDWRKLKCILFCAGTSCSTTPLYLCNRKLDVWQRGHQF